MRLWTNIFLPVKALLEFLLICKDETIAHKLNDTHKSNAGLLLLGAFADWVGNRLSLYLMEAGTDKGQDPLEIRAFRQKESTATLIHIVSKLRCFFGGASATNDEHPSQLVRSPSSPSSISSSRMSSIVIGVSLPFKTKVNRSSYKYTARRKILMIPRLMFSSFLAPCLSE